MIIKRIGIVSLIILLSLCNFSYAETVNTITVESVNYTDGYCVVKGSISCNSEEVTLLVLDEFNEISYIDQKTSDASGKFEFRFKLKNEEQYGEYTVKVGGRNVATPAVQLFNYVQQVTTVENKVIEGDISVDVSWYIPTISGQITCYEEKQLEIEVNNVTDDTEIASEVITAEDGAFDFSYTLPSLLYSKDYTITIKCMDDNSELISMPFELSSNTISLTVNGNISMADNMKMTGTIQSSNIESLNKSFNITGNESMSFTLPNLLASMSCDMNFECFEKVQKNIYITYYYDSDNRMIQIDKSNGKSLIFTYDNMGNLLTKTVRGANENE